MTAESFFKRFDRFPKGVTLTYKQAGALPTSMGGIGTIIMYCAFLFWFTTEYLDIYAGNGKFLKSSNLELTQRPDGTFPEYSINN